jgi:hypothetical protein
MAISPRELRENRQAAERMLKTILAEARGDRRVLQTRLATEARRLVGSRDDAQQNLGVLLLNAAGFTIQQNDQGKLIATQRPTDEQGNPAPAQARRSTILGIGRGNDGTGTESHLDDDGWNRGYQEQRLAARQEPKIFTPESSNVHSFTWFAPGNPSANREVIGTLYVTYKAPTINSDNVTVGRNASGFKQLRGRAGSTISGKSDGPGVTYAYYRVPRIVFEKMKSATSKGKFVWNNLRTRGTIYGHKYQYGVVSGAMIEHNNEPLEYVPRKATRNGLKKRALANVTQRAGRRGYVTSTLPERPSGSYLRHQQGK